jgi:homogentisate 1,2-dioxygenase
MEIEKQIRYTALAVGLMEIENLIRYAPRAVGLKPSAMRGEARLRGLYRIMYSKDHYALAIALANISTVTTSADTPRRARSRWISSR